MRNAKLAITSKKTDLYPIRNKPEIWLTRQGITPTCLYAAVICLSPSTPLSRDHEMILLLTRDKLPNFPTFPVFLEEDIETTVHCFGLDGFLGVNPSSLQLLTDFTLAVFHDLFHKTYAAAAEELPYWLAPLIKLTPQPSPGKWLNIFDMIDWGALQYIQSNPQTPWSEDMDPESLIDRFFYDGWNGKYQYFSIAIDPYLRPSDPPPYYAPSRKWDENIMNWSTSLSKNARLKFLDHCRWSQPVVHAELIGVRRNFLDKATEEEKSEDCSRCAICPQALDISPVSLIPLVLSL